MAAIFYCCQGLSTSKRCGANLRLASTLTSMKTGHIQATPLHYAVLAHRKVSPQIRERLECISVLLEAGASVDTLPMDERRCIPLREASPQHTRRHRNALGGRRRS